MKAYRAKTSGIKVVVVDLPVTVLCSSMEAFCQWVQSVEYSLVRYIYVRVWITYITTAYK